MRFRIGFLPAFFVTLGLFVAAVAWVRIRSYQATSAEIAATAPDLAESPTQPEGSPRSATVVPVVEGNVAPGGVVSELSVPGPVNEVRPAVVETAGAAKASLPVTSVATAVSGGTAVAVQSGGTAAALQSAPAVAPKPPASETPPEPEKDQDSDNLPPHLVSIEFLPPQIEDGQETLLRIEAVDDLTGVRSISGSIMAPNGTVQGFACTRDGNTNRYVSRVLVPVDAPDGVWRVNFIVLSDQANNMARLSPSNGMVPPTAFFRVVSHDADEHGPTLRALWLERRSMRSGEKNTLLVQADDDKSGISVVSGVFQSPSRLARIGFICKAREGNSWACELTAPPCADCGDWHLEQVQLQDKANNMTSVRGDNPLIAPVLLDISSEQCDATPPAVEAVSLDKKSVSNIEPSMVSVTATFSDDVCGIQSVSAHVLGPTGPEGAPSMSFSFNAGNDPRVWIGRFNVPQRAAKGTWRIDWLQVLDKGRNLRAYSQADPVLVGATFDVH